jgi:hypothetical protein
VNDRAALSRGGPRLDCREAKAHDPEPGRLGTRDGGQSQKHLPRYLDEYAFRLTGALLARLIETAVETGPTPYWAIVGRKIPNLKLVEG